MWSVRKAKKHFKRVAHADGVKVYRARQGWKKEGLIVFRAMKLRIVKRRPMTPQDWQRR